MKAQRLYVVSRRFQSSRGPSYSNPPPPPQYPPQYPMYAYPMMPPPPPPPPPMPVGSPERPLFVSVVPGMSGGLPPRRFMFFFRSATSFFIFGAIMSGIFYVISKSFYVIVDTDDKSSSKTPSPVANSRISSLWGSNEPKPVKLDNTTVRFADVRGCDEAKEELEEIVLFLKDPKKFKSLGGKLPKGALLVGPPGCGKTMLAKAIAKEAGVSFFYCSGSEFDEMFVGVGARRIRDLFSAAKNHGPSLIFIDEIDAIGSSRTVRDMSYTRMTLNQLLSEMDGFNSSDEVIVIGATNTPDTLDKALTRPGRFDRHISVDPPDIKGRKQILDLYLSKIIMDPLKALTEVAETVARGTIGFTGADLQNLVNLAAIRAVMVGRTNVSIEELEYARDRVMMGAENHSKKLSEKEKHDTAYHEGGHALVAMLLETSGADPVHKATIIPRGSGVLGLVQQLPEADRYSINRQQMITRMTIALAGRAAEEIILGQDKVTSGAMSDFQQATKIARSMVRRYGFNNGDNLGVVDYETADTNEGAHISEKTKQAIENETRAIIMESYNRAKDLLTTNRVLLDRVAKGLIEFETLSGAELKQLIANPKDDLQSVFEKLRKEGKTNSSELAEKTKKLRKESIESIQANNTANSNSKSGGRGMSIPILSSKAKNN